MYHNKNYLIESAMKFILNAKLATVWKNFNDRKKDPKLQFFLSYGISMTSKYVKVEIEK